jgi:hypothetical protein
MAAPVRPPPIVTSPQAGPEEGDDDTQVLYSPREQPTSAQVSAPVSTLSLYDDDNKPPSSTTGKRVRVRQQSFGASSTAPPAQSPLGPVIAALSLSATQIPIEIRDESCEEHMHDERSFENTKFFERVGHTGATHYVFLREDPLTHLPKFVPAEVSGRPGDIVICRTTLGVAPIASSPAVRGMDSRDSIDVAATASLSMLNTAPSSPDHLLTMSNPVSSPRPHTTHSGALMMTLEHPGTHEYALRGSAVAHLTVHVADLHHDVNQHGAICITAFIGIVILAVAIVLTVLMAKADSIFEALLGGLTSSEIIERIATIFYDHAFAWFVLAIFVFLALLLVRIGVALRREHVHEFRRGYRSIIRLRWRFATAAVTGLVVGLSLSVWFFLLVSNDGFATFFAVLSQAADKLLYNAISVASSVQVLADQLPTVYPAMVVPNATATLNQITRIVDTARSWTDNGEELVRSAFRLVAVLRFVSLSVILYGCAVALNGAYFGSASVTRGATWVQWLSLVAACLAIGVSSFLLGLAEEAHTFGSSLFTNTTAELSNATGIKNAAILELIVSCSTTGSVLSPAFFNQVTGTAFAQWNRDAPASMQLPTNITLSVDKHVLESQIQYLMGEIDLIQTKINQSPDAFMSSVASYSNVTVPLVKAALTVTKNAVAIADCSAILDDLRGALDVLQKRVIHPLNIQVSFLKALIAFLFVATPVSGVTSFLLRRPYKKWYCWTTQRWFRFRVSLLAHRAVNARLGSNSKELVKRLNGNFVVPGAPWFSVSGFLHAVYLFHHTVTLLEFLLGNLLVMLHRSGESNRLPALLLAGTAILMMPVWLIPLEAQLCRCCPAIPVPALRAAAAIFSLTTLSLTFAYAVVGATQTTECIAELQHQRRPAGSGFSYPFTQTCTADRVSRLLEMTVYAAVVAVVCVFSFIAAFIILLSFRRRFWKEARRRLSVFGEDVGATELRTSSRTFGESQSQSSMSAVLPPAVDQLTLSQAEKTSSVQSIVVNPQIGEKRRQRVGFATILLLFCVLAPLATPLFYSADQLTAETDATIQRATADAFVIPAVGCNGQDSFCSRRVNEMVWAATHNSMSSSSAGFVAPNHFYSMDESLRAGYRVFLIDLHFNDTADGAIASQGGAPLSVAESVLLCHQACFLGWISMLNEMKVLKAFLMERSRDIVILSLEQYVPTAAIMEVFAAADMTSMLWAPAKSPADDGFEWPTLNDLIRAGQRVIVFNDVVPGTALSPEPVPSQILYAFDYTVETNYAVSSLSAFNCNLTRGFTLEFAALKRKMTLLNHFVSAPLASPFSASEANKGALISQRYQDCAASWQQLFGPELKPNMIAVDFWGTGDTLRTVEALNAAN